MKQRIPNAIWVSPEALVEYQQVVSASEAVHGFLIR